MWQVAIAFFAGLGVGEYYHWRYDKIRQEQLKELRAQRVQAQQEQRDVVYVSRRAPRRASDDLISPEQFDEMQSVGRTGGKRINN